MTATDQTFEAAKPSYYVYEDEHEERCVLCGKKFKTRLSCNRFCSHAHQERLLCELTGQKK